MDYLNQIPLEEVRSAWVIAFAAAIPCFILLFWKLRPGLGRSLAVTAVSLLFLSPCYNYFYLDPWWAGTWPSMLYILNLPEDPLGSIVMICTANAVPRLLMAALILSTLEAARRSRQARRPSIPNKYPPFA